ncbi:hypothetical protein AnaeK_2902 [Anaeromyxobacter sp. K]|uniref:hypothetical protein n=1 Tax=Anaeromyxobacter sp. (strain K) TaxID=447217 RepID=UPI00015F8A4C|nr:hypothetical protein [Anaeromyxobacter sp. K]ACG74126.1 hypothetical protein AnaeK_2902 [Anaeromyxobacter sp. K]
MTQSERLARRTELRVEIAKHEAALAALRADEARLLEDCDHTYADGRSAGVGGAVRVCAVCGRVLKHRDEKLWG